MNREPKTYTYRQVATRGCEILGTDGKVFAWTIDDVWAAVICRLLNEHAGPDDGDWPAWGWPTEQLLEYAEQQSSECRRVAGTLEFYRFRLSESLLMLRDRLGDGDEYRALLARHGIAAADDDQCRRKGSTTGSGIGRESHRMIEQAQDEVASARPS